MGAAMVGTMSTCTGISSPDNVSTCTVTIPSRCCVLAAFPNDAKEMSVVDDGDRPNSLTMSRDMKER